MEKSVWTDTVTLKKHEALQGDVSTDVLVIGGGLCGILCTYFLKKAGVDCLLVEGEEIAGGMTKNTTAKITSQHGLVYDGLIRTLGRERARIYLEANEKGLEEYRRLCGSISCGFEEKTAYVYSLRDQEMLEREVRAVNSLGFPAEFAQRLSLPLPVKGAVAFPRQAQFHPLEFIAGIQEGLPVYEHPFVENIEGHTAFTARGKIRADRFIVTPIFPLSIGTEAIF